MDRTGTGLAPVGEGPHQAHLVGLDGRGMSGLAQMLVQRGFVVTGSVPAPSPATDRLRRLGVRVHAGHSPRSVPRSARFLVYSPEVPREHPDRLSAATVGVEQHSSPEVLAGPAPSRGRDRRVGRAEGGGGRGDGRLDLDPRRARPDRRPGRLLDRSLAAAGDSVSARM